MNEILARKYIKQIIKYGISKDMARDIVETAIGVSKGNNLDMAINYAINLTYGIQVKKFAK